MYILLAGVLKTRDPRGWQASVRYGWRVNAARVATVPVVRWLRLVLLLTCGRALILMVLGFRRSAYVTVVPSIFGVRCHQDLDFRWISDGAIYLLPHLCSFRGLVEEWRLSLRTLNE